MDQVAAADLVAQLARDELDSIAAEVAAGRTRRKLRSLDERGVAQELVRQQYSGRYPFELLQNAADAAADIGRSGRVLFHLSEEALLVADNGAGFGPEQIESICTLGGSTKSPTKSVGYKGLGFKSVGEITDRPQVNTADVRFGFDDDRVNREVSTALGAPLPEGQRLPTYAFPFPLRDGELGDDEALVDKLLADGYSTVMRLPLRADVDRAVVEAQLRENVEPQLMVFLNTIGELALTGTTADFIAVSARSADGAAEQVLLEVDDEVTEWLVYTRRLPVDAALVAPLGHAWSKVETVTAAIAVPVGSDGRPMTDCTYPLHVYFPTDEQAGFAFIAHADWSLHLDRRQLSNAPEVAAYNQFLVDAVVGLVCEVVAPDLADRFDDPAVPASVLAPRGTPTGAGAALHHSLMRALPDVEFVATVLGNLASPRTVRLLPAKCPDVHALHELAETSPQPALVLADVEADPAVRAALVKLGAATLTLDATLALLRPPTDDSALAYYRHLVDWEAGLPLSLYAKSLAGVACVRTQDGHVVTPSSKVFFARTNDDVPIELPLPIAVLPDGVNGLTGLLEAAGVGRFDWRDIIPDYVVPLLTETGTNDGTRHLALNALRAYLRTRRRPEGDRDVRAAVADVLLPARDHAGRFHELVPARKVYFPADWTGDTRLEGIYGPFGDVEFLDVPVPDDPQVRERELELWKFCGVADSPRVLSVEAEGSRAYLTVAMWQGAHPHQSNSHWQSWWADEEVEAAKVCRADHPLSQQLLLSHTLDRFSNLVAAGDPGRLRLLWTALALGWSSVYEAASTAKFRCVHGNHFGDERTAPSLLKHALMVSLWVPVRRGQEVELVAPWQAWRVAPSTPRHIRSRVPALAETMSMGQAQRLLMLELGVADAARLTPDDLFDLLRDLRDEAAEGDPDDNQVKAARWAMRALNDALQVGVHQVPDDPVPLLASIDGRYVFATDPLVVRDPMLREAWGSRRPVLAADEDCHTLVKVMGLVPLDDHVVVAPHEVGHRQDLAEQIQAHVDRAAPWMLALLRKLRASAEETFVPRIKRLDVRPCNELILEYAFDGETVELPAAVAHIASRVELAPRPGGLPPGPAMFGTAYLEVDRATGAPPWFEFGPQLAAFVRADNYGDQFGQILASDDATRAQFLASKRISTDDVLAAAETLGRTDLVLEDLVDPAIPDTDQEPADDVETGVPDPAAGPGAGGTGDDDTEPKTEGGAATGSGTSGGGGSSSGGSLGTTPAGEAGTVEPTDGSGGSATPPLELPALDVDAIVVEDGDPGPAAPTVGPGGGGGGGGGFGGAWTPEPAISDKEKRALGRRGEEAVYLAERRRVADLGLDPDEVVVWRADAEQFAPYDIVSVDEHGVSVFIEVKSTTGADPCAPFDMSHGELNEAIRYGDKFRVYRVTSVRTAAPRITRYTNPVALVRSGMATLDVSKARLRFGREAPDEEQ